ncbi:TM144-like protein [Mya arenaria]|uniref:TM144-like protein n=1 Tax=Mya arenaria TaxID=6604 RepID=A0ABY7FGG8_MYAAR|nr:TM144-like protein [Mya arenaria]
MATLFFPSEVHLEQTTNMSTLTNSTVCPETSGIPHVWGFVSAFVAIFFFGTNFAPVKKFDTGDGNICVVPIVKTIGLGLGLFGLFGTNSDPPDNKALNDIGVILAVCSGIILSLVSGIFYGQMFTPSIYIQDNYKTADGHKASQEALDYVFATFSGILATGTVYFLIYAAIQKNHPKIYPRAILPGFISGTMWAVATSGWFVANKVLSEAVAFPIITTGPGVIASILGVLVFKEIKGRRNILILMFGMSVTITGSVLAGLSKKAPKSPC